MGVEWFRRLGDIPGVTYVTPNGIDRSKLRGASDRPEVYRFPSLPPSLSWPTRGGETSQSPASRSADVDFSEKRAPAVLRRLHETLELPGEASDYHFAIQRVVEELWSRRRRESLARAQLENLAWLDIELIRARPETITNEYADAHPEQPRFYNVLAFSRLMFFYEREGALLEALEVAELGMQFGQQIEAKRDELVTRAAALAEDGS